LPVAIPSRGILAPAQVSDALESKIQALRAQGEVVIQPLIPIEGVKIAENGIMVVEGVPCDRILVSVNDAWLLQPMSQKMS